MSPAAEGQRSPQGVQRMFARIARRYDLLNRLMTLGQDIRWRREVVRRLDPAEVKRYLDLGQRNPAPGPWKPGGGR